jgi:hypothetical protein
MEQNSRISNGDNTNYIWEKVKSRLNLENACYLSFQDLFFFMSTVQLQMDLSLEAIVATEFNEIFSARQLIKM